jgi:nickel transport protein
MKYSVFFLPLARFECGPTAAVRTTEIEGAPADTANALPTPRRRAWRHGATAVLLLYAVALAPPAAAHALRLSAQVDGPEVRGQVLYSDMTPARQEAVELHAADGASDEASDEASAVLARTRTDDDGRFRLSAPAGVAYRVVVWGEEGHRAELLVRPSLAAGAVTGTVADAAALLRAELQPLREDIARMEQRIRWHDVLGGVGYIVGLCGLAAWFLSRRRP